MARHDIKSNGMERKGLKRFYMTLGMAAAAALGAALTTACAPGRDAAGAGPAAAQTEAQAAPGNLRIAVGLAVTRRGDTVPLSADFSLELRGDSVVARLPYFGRAYAATLGDGSPLSFAARVAGFASGRAADGSTEMEFEARTREDLFRFRLRLYADGRATVDVFPQRRDRIGFEGEVE